MDFLEFLYTLSNTLEKIDVHGKENVENMFVCFQAIQSMQKSISESQRMTHEEPKEVENIATEGEVDG